MHLYEWGVLRVVPRVERGEFVNAGVVVYCQALGFLAAEVAFDEARWRALDAGVDADAVRVHLTAARDLCAGAPAAGVNGARRRPLPLAHRPPPTVLQPSPVHRPHRRSRHPARHLFAELVRPPCADRASRPAASFKGTASLPSTATGLRRGETDMTTSTAPPAPPSRPLRLLRPLDVIDPQDRALLDRIRAFMEPRSRPSSNSMWTKERFPSTSSPLRRPGARRAGLRRLRLRHRGYLVEGLVMMELASIDSSIATFQGVHSGWPSARSTPAAPRSRSSAGCRR